MGFMDKLKAAAGAVTGGAADVSIEYQPQVLFPGDTMQAKVTATARDAEVKSKGAFVDLRGLEVVHVARSDAMTEKDVRTSKATYDHAFQIAPAFVLGPNETKVFEGSFQIPAVLQPSFTGAYAEHKWEIRGRVEAFGNDPDSGWQPLRIGLKA